LRRRKFAGNLGPARRETEPSVVPWGVPDEKEGANGPRRPATGPGRLAELARRGWRPFPAACDFCRNLVEKPKGGNPFFPRGSSFHLLGNRAKLDFARG